MTMNEQNPEEPTLPPSVSPEPEENSPSETLPTSIPDFHPDMPTIHSDVDFDSEVAPTMIGSQGEEMAEVGDLPTGRYFGEYELLEEIARGGMGVVYKAKQVKLNRLVALKMILSGQLASQADVKRFHVEAEAAALLDHPGIVPIFEVGEHDGQHYFSMGYVEGGSLSERIRNRPLPVEEAVQVVRKLAEAMNYAHEKGVIHRDLKPANVLLANSDSADAVFFSGEPAGKYEPKITDFGLARNQKADSQLTGTGQVLGTPSYMPPEQAGGKTEQMGPLCDVYSLGAILYCLITGRPPFQAASPMETLLQLLEKDPVSPRELNQQVPKDLETICLKCLEKEPKKRYQSAKELADELDRFLKHEPIQARPVGRIERAIKWVKRRPVVAGLAAAAVLCLVLGTVVSTMFAIEASRRADAEAEQKEIAEQHAKDARYANFAHEQARELAESREKEAKAARNAAVVNLYAASAFQFRRAWERNEYGRLNQLLNRWDPKFITAENPNFGLPDPRGFEWHYLKAQSEKTIAELLGHDGSVLSVSWGPGKDELASAGQDNGIRIWSLSTGQTRRILKGHTSNVYEVEWSPSGDHIAACGLDKTARVWDAKTGELLYQFKDHNEIVDAVEFSPDGRLLATSGRDGILRIWDVNTGGLIQALRKIESGERISRLDWSHDGRWLAIGGHSDQTRIWNTKTWELERQWKSGWYNDVAWGPDDQILAVCDRKITFWNPSTGEKLRAVDGHQGPILSLSWNANGQLASAGNDHTVRIWNGSTGEPIRTLRMHSRTIRSVAWSSDGTQLASGGNDSLVKVYAENPKADQFKTLPLRTRGIGLAWCANDGRLAHIGWDGLTFWEVATGEAVNSVKASFIAVDSTPDGRYLVLQDHRQNISVWDAFTKREIAMYPNPSGQRTLDIAISPDGKKMAGATKQTLFVWRATDGQVLQEIPIKRINVIGIDWHPEKNLIAISGQPATIFLVDLDYETAHRLPGHSDAVYEVRFRPDGNLLASGGSGGQVRLWDISQYVKNRGTNISDPQRDLRMLKELQGHTSSIKDLAWSSNGRRLVTAGSDETARIWDVTTGEQLLVFRHEAPVMGVAWNQHMTRLATCDQEGVYLWTTAEDKHHRNYLPEGKLITLDLQPVGNLRLDQIVHGTSDQQAHWKPLLEDRGQDNPTMNLNGIPYEIGPQLIQLARKEVPELPTKVTGIACDQHVDKLHILHTAAWAGVRVGTKIGEYRLNYEEGSSEVLPIVVGENIREWTFPFENDLPKARVAWQKGYKQNYRIISLYHVIWENPHPEKKVATIDVVSSETSSSPFCVAMTVESPSTATWITRAKAFRQARDFPAAIKAYEAAILWLKEHNQDAALQGSLLLELAEVHGSIQHWELAESAFTRAMQLNAIGKDHLPWYWRTFLLAYQEDWEAYRQHRAKILELFGDTQETMIAERIGKAAGLLPDESFDNKKLLALTGIALKESPDNEWNLLAHSLSLVRNKDYDTAAELLEKIPSTRGPCGIAGRFLTAINLVHRNQPEEAQTVFQSVVKDLDRSPFARGLPTPGNWQDGLFCLILKREYESLIKKEDPNPAN